MRVLQTAADFINALGVDIREPLRLRCGSYATFLFSNVCAKSAMILAAQGRRASIRRGAASSGGWTCGARDGGAVERPVWEQWPRGGRGARAEYGG